ncbi:hypothetical protein L6452_03606 [Arctium lappa]|uniref:Uncharacterized protein n=1 Tax=Arctium lappa TaxID=4217 RepID=A0ACB9FNP6_ARCLA|nr:hypothetical protein L6452_03606 [Arctium lappa]
MSSAQASVSVQVLLYIQAFTWRGFLEEAQLTKLKQLFARISDLVEAYLRKFSIAIEGDSSICICVF